ncbi:hypothetical protein Cyrtocomes_00209 [Candidatus Cyrtobacter comes]|uniref:Uncharacterized protein n=1 Tax=Candidatus Cyrtobacter comes TaxID=675776 RepID=A0ABU5L6V2_9RICK|nr:hypothetical protein [Candidatus Cyrtobacter comes]MDZ5761851.1 hypothetical protein [Candidatus Cyrtobacter comes]
MPKGSTAKRGRKAPKRTDSVFPFVNDWNRKITEKMREDQKKKEAAEHGEVSKTEQEVQRAQEEALARKMKEDSAGAQVEKKESGKIVEAKDKTQHGVKELKAKDETQHGVKELKAKDETQHGVKELKAYIELKNMLESLHARLERERKSLKELEGQLETKGADIDKAVKEHDDASRLFQCENTVQAWQIALGKKEAERDIMVQYINKLDQRLNEQFAMAKKHPKDLEKIHADIKKITELRDKAHNDLETLNHVYLRMSENLTCGINAWRKFKSAQEEHAKLTAGIEYIDKNIKKIVGEINDTLIQFKKTWAPVEDAFSRINGEGYVSTLTIDALIKDLEKANGEIAALRAAEAKKAAKNAPEVALAGRPEAEQANEGANAINAADAPALLREQTGKIKNSPVAPEVAIETEERAVNISQLADNLGSLMNMTYTMRAGFGEFTDTLSNVYNLLNKMPNNEGADEGAFSLLTDTAVDAVNPPGEGCLLQLDAVDAVDAVNAVNAVNAAIIW